MPKEAGVKTAKKWEKELRCNLKYETNAGKAIDLRCKDCKRWQDRIQSLKNFLDIWVTGTQNMEKDVMKKHIESCDAHKEDIINTLLKLLGTV